MILINELKRQRPNKNYLFQWHKKKHKNLPRKFNKIVPPSQFRPKYPKRM